MFVAQVPKKVPKIRIYIINSYFRVKLKSYKQLGVYVCIYACIYRECL